MLLNLLGFEVSEVSEVSVIREGVYLRPCEETR